MSKTSQLKRSMYELGKIDVLKYRKPIYSRRKEYMRGYRKGIEKWNEGKWLYLSSKKQITLPRYFIFLVTVTVTIYIGSLLV